MAVPLGQSSIGSNKPPPPMPSMPEISVSLFNYLTQFSLWCRNGFSSQLRAGVALPGILLQADDTPPGQAPAVFMIRVKTDGTIVAVPIALATGEF
jgi:hypothetical protein